MSQRLKSDVRRVEKSDSRWNREEDQQHSDDEVETGRKQQSSETRQREKVHDVERKNDRHYHRDRVDQRKRRHRSDDETADIRSSRRSNRDVRERSRHGSDEDTEQRQLTDDRHSANGMSYRRVENERRHDSENEKQNEEGEDEKYMKAKRAKVEDTLTTRTGGAYIPPARLRMMQVSIVL